MRYGKENKVVTRRRIIERPDAGSGRDPFSDAFGPHEKTRLGELERKQAPNTVVC